MSDIDWLSEVLHRPSALLEQARSAATASMEARREILQSPSGEGPQDVETLKPDAKTVTEVPLDLPLPGKVATLLVQAEGSDEYTLLGFCDHPGLARLETARRRIPDLSLADFREQRLEPSAVDFLLVQFANGNPELRHWLTRLVREVGDDLIVVLQDCTGCEVPWEFFKISDDEQRSYLGTAATVTRWLNTEDQLGSSLEWTNIPNPTPGDILAYVNQEREGPGNEAAYELPQALTEWKWLDSWPCRSLSSDIKLFMTALTEERGPHALVYLACHGNFHAEDLLQLYLGSVCNARQQLKLKDLERRPLHLLRAFRSIVFINACHSGRLNVKDEHLRDGRQRGFVELFLRKGASGVIATLGGVRDTLASETARRLLQQIVDQPDIPVAKLLRDLRRTAAAAVRDQGEDLERDLEMLIHCFMYVYYGSPWTRIQLKSGKE